MVTNMFFGRNKKNDGGKGDKQRPTDNEKFKEGWDRIFGDKQKENK